MSNIEEEARAIERRLRDLHRAMVADHEVRDVRIVRRCIMIIRQTRHLADRLEKCLELRAKSAEVTKEAGYD